MTAIKVLCPNCAKEMQNWDDGWYCPDYLIQEVDPNAEDCNGYLTYTEGQAQWDEHGKKEIAMLESWIAWAHRGAGR